MQRVDVQVLEVAAGQVVVGDNLDLAVAGGGDLDVVAKVVDTALNLDAVLEELLEGGDVEDLVVGGLLGVDDELRKESGLVEEMGWRGGIVIRHGSKRVLHTFLVVFWALPPFLVAYY